MIRFNNYDADWEEKQLVDEFPFIRNGFVGTVTNFFSDKDKGIRYLEGTNIHNGIISDNVEVYVTKEFHKKHIKNQLKRDDILMVQSGHVGDCAVVGEKYEGANCHALIVMSNGGNCDSRFIVYYFNSPHGKKKIHVITTGNTVKHILASDMNKFKLNIPCLEEQQKIADCLSSVDELIADYEAQVENMQNQKKGVMQKIFSQEVRFKADDGSEFTEWEITTLGNVIEFIRNGFSYVADGKRNYRYKITRIETISSGVINVEKLGSSEVIDEKYLLLDGDILYSHINSLQYLGNTAQYHNELGEIYHGMNLLCIRPNKETIEPKFLHLVFKTENARRFVKINAKPAVHQASIPSSDLTKMKIQVPCKEEQQKIADCLTAFDNAIEDLQKTVEYWKNVKKGLLQQLFDWEGNYN